MTTTEATAYNYVRRGIARTRAELARVMGGQQADRLDGDVAQGIFTRTPKSRPDPFRSTPISENASGSGMSSVGALPPVLRTCRRRAAIRTRSAIP